MSLKAVLFDVDGTLLDTHEYVYQAFEHSLKKHHKLLSRQEIKKIMGKPLEECYKILTELDDITDLADSHRQFQRENYHLSKPYPNTVKTLEKLQSSGLLLAAITTRARDSAKKTLEEASILNYFNYFIGFEDVSRPKPDAEPLLKALNFLSVQPKEAIMVGDSEVDVYAGKNAGTKTVGVTYGFHGEHIAKTHPDYVIDDIEELLKIVI